MSAPLPLVNFLLEDMLAAALAVCLYPLFLLVPGFLLASALNLCDYTKRSPAERLGVGLVVSIAVVPGLTYLLSRLSSLPIVCVLFVTLSFFIGLPVFSDQGGGMMLC